MTTKHTPGKWVWHTHDEEAWRIYGTARACGWNKALCCGQTSSICSSGGRSLEHAATFDAICLVINLHRPVDVRTRIRELMGERRAIDQIIKFRCILDVLRLVFWRFCVLIWIHDALLDE